MRLSLHPVATLLALLFPAVASAQVVVNEIMYTPASPEPEWIEHCNI